MKKKGKKDKGTDAKPQKSIEELLAEFKSTLTGQVMSDRVSDMVMFDEIAARARVVIPEAPKPPDLGAFHHLVCRIREMLIAMEYDIAILTGNTPPEQDATSESATPAPVAVEPVATGKTLDLGKFLRERATMTDEVRDDKIRIPLFRAREQGKKEFKQMRDRIMKNLGLPNNEYGHRVIASSLKTAENKKDRPHWIARFLFRFPQEQWDAWLDEMGVWFRGVTAKALLEEAQNTRRWKKMSAAQKRKNA